MFVDECHVTRLNQGLFSTTMEAEKRDAGNEVVEDPAAECLYGRSRTHDLPRDNPMLNQLSHQFLSLSLNSGKENKILGFKETVLLHRLEGETLKFSFIKRVDKGLINILKGLKVDV